MSKQGVVLVLVAYLAGCGDPAPTARPEVTPFTPVSQWVPDHSYGVGSSSPSPEVEHPGGLSVPVATPPAIGQVAHRQIVGIASTYGPGFAGLFALPSPWGRGHRVRICSTVTSRCLTRRSNDQGPEKRLHRVADLDVATFEYLCDCSRTQGLQKVSLEFLDE